MVEVLEQRYLDFSCWRAECLVCCGYEEVSAFLRGLWSIDCYSYLGSLTLDGVLAWAVLKPDRKIIIRMRSFMAWLVGLP